MILGKNETALLPAFRELAVKIKNGDTNLDKGGTQFAEVLGLQAVLDPAQAMLKFPGRETDTDYAAKELRWYLSKDLHIAGWVDDVKIWRQVAGTDGTINSNYGNLVFSEDNGYQFQNAMLTLTAHKSSRQAIIIYQRPGMHDDWKKNGKQDFICTNFQHLMIRQNKLHCVTSMRSQDCWFGLFNDVPWFHHVIIEALGHLRKVYPDLILGEHVYQVNSFHAYERHFDQVQELVAACYA